MSGAKTFSSPRQDPCSGRRSQRQRSTRCLLSSVRSSFQRRQLLSPRRIRGPYLLVKSLLLPLNSRRSWHRSSDLPPTVPQCSVLDIRAEAKPREAGIKVHNSRRILKLCLCICVLKGDQRTEDRLCRAAHASLMDFVKGTYRSSVTHLSLSAPETRSFLCAGGDSAVTSNIHASRTHRASPLLASRVPNLSSGRRAAINSGIVTAPQKDERYERLAHYPEAPPRASGDDDVARRLRPALVLGSFQQRRQLSLGNHSNL